MGAFSCVSTSRARIASDLRQTAMYLPWRGSTLQFIEAGSKAELVISATESCSWYAFSAEMTGAYDDTTKWMRGYGTRLVWNSVTSTLRAPSKRSDAVSDEMIWAMRRLRLVYVGRSMSRLRRQMSYRASLSTMKDTSVCSNSEWVESTQLYGSTTAVETCGDG